MKLIYVAGAFRAPTHWGIVQNVRRAEYWALKVWRMGDVAVCPHLNTANFQGALDDDVWLEGDLVLMGRCDGVLMIPGWFSSVGAVEEAKVARRNNIPVFYSWDEYLDWRLLPDRSECAGALGSDTRGVANSSGGAGHLRC